MAELTIDQELDLLDDAFRRLKVEYDIYFAGGTKRPPVDNESRLMGRIRGLMENSRLNFVQRYRVQNAAQRHAVFCDLWRRKARVKDQGYLRPEDKLLGVGGFGHLDPPRSPAAQPRDEAENFVLFSDDVFEVVPLYEAVLRARELVGQPLGAFDAFASFVQLKTNSIRKQFKCEAVEYTVMVKDGQVRLTARARKDV
ncbi:MAG: MXAN_5187 C-terminal domain-containing protein [Candidatus Korobacteraceae bacterium]